MEHADQKASSKPKSDNKLATHGDRAWCEAPNKIKRRESNNPETFKLPRENQDTEGLPQMEEVHRPCAQALVDLRGLFNFRQSQHEDSYQAQKVSHGPFETEGAVREEATLDGQAKANDPSRKMGRGYQGGHEEGQGPEQAVRAR